MEAPHADAVLARPGLPPHLSVVEVPRDEHVEDVTSDGGRQRGPVAEGRKVSEPKHLGDDGEEHRPLRAEAEADDERRGVEPVSLCRPV